MRHLAGIHQAPYPQPGRQHDQQHAHTARDQGQPRGGCHDVRNGTFLMAVPQGRHPLRRGAANAEIQRPRIADQPPRQREQAKALTSESRQQMGDGDRRDQQRQP
ncbi:hypothetical protein D3C81_1764090 [compost metagenome]